MTAERKKLAKRFVKCERWRWMPGMKALYTGDQCHRVTMADAYGVPAIIRPPHARWAWPDLNDPATLGCILALVRQCFAHAVIWTSRDCTVDALDADSFCMDETEGWSVCIGTVDDYVGEIGRGATEAEALLSALEFASTLEAA